MVAVSDAGVVDVDTAAPVLVFVVAVVAADLFHFFHS